MGSRYILLVPSRVVIDAEAGMQEFASVLLVKGLLVTALQIPRHWREANKKLDGVGPISQAVQALWSARTANTDIISTLRGEHVPCYPFQCFNNEYAFTFQLVAFDNMDARRRTPFVGRAVSPTSQRRSRYNPRG